MKIIKEGKVETSEKKKTCYNCKTKFFFNDEEVNLDIRDGNYINCPMCGAFIAVN